MFYGYYADSFYMLEFWKRVKFLLKDKNINQQDIAGTLDMRPDTFSKWVQKDRLPDAEETYKIAEALGVSVEYLVTGNEVHRIDGFDKLPTNGSNDDIALIEMYRIEAAAGKGLEVAEYYDVTQIPVLERFIYPYKAHQVKAVVVKGDSMEGVQICHNDIVLFVPEEREGNGIFVISINNKVLVKRLEFNPAEHCIKVLSENEKYAPIIIAENGTDTLTVNGRVIVVLHRAA